MGVSFKHWSGVLTLAALMASGNVAVFAQESASQDEPLNRPTVSETLDQANGFDSYWEDESIGGDANFLFSAESPERVILNSSDRIEAVYKDLLKQQDEDSPILRTRDLANPYETSLLELQSLSGLGNSEERSIPPFSSPVMAPPEAEAPVVPGLW